eukprot:scaffold231829_cov32-Tisochrysis_lutea.AAC.4
MPRSISQSDLGRIVHLHQCVSFHLILTTLILVTLNRRSAQGHVAERGCDIEHTSGRPHQLLERRCKPTKYNVCAWH